MKSLFLPLFALGALATFSVQLANASVGNRVQSMNFDVFLDDRVIGYQRFELTQGGDGFRMQTRAKFKVKFLLITAFEYDHQNTEVWRGGCLQMIDSRTDSNGKMYTVSGQVEGDVFLVETNEGKQKLDDCVSSFAYWDKDLLLQSQRLLNSQTGEYMAVRVETLGRDRMRVGDRDVSVDRYALLGKGLDITLAYTVGGGVWVALDNKLDGGQMLSYRRSLTERVKPVGSKSALVGSLGAGL